jgi:hypothetical protein
MCTHMRMGVQYMRRRVKVRIGIVWLVSLAASALMNSQYRFTKQKDSLCKLDIDEFNMCNISEEVSGGTRVRA